MRTGSVSAAARDMGMSQPAVSQLIAGLEQAVGLPLFVRRNGGIFPTSRAEGLHDDVSDLLALLDRVEMHLRPRSDKLLPHVRISATMSVVTEILPPLLTEMHRLHPSGSYHVASHAIDEMTNAVAEGHADFGFHTRPLPHPNIVNLLQCDARQVCVMSDGHPLAAADRLTLSDLSGMDFILPSRRDPLFAYYRDLFSRHRVSGKVLLQSPFASFSMHMSGLNNAVSFNNALMAALTCRNRPGLVWKPVEGLEARTGFHLSFPTLLAGSETQELVARCFAAVVDGAVGADARLAAMVRAGA